MGFPNRSADKYPVKLANKYLDRSVQNNHAKSANRSQEKNAHRSRNRNAQKSRGKRVHQSTNVKSAINLSMDDRTKKNEIMYASVSENIQIIVFVVYLKLDTHYKTLKINEN